MSRVGWLVSWAVILVAACTPQSDPAPLEPSETSVTATTTTTTTAPSTTTSAPTPSTGFAALPPDDPGRLPGLIAVDAGPDGVHVVVRPGGEVVSELDGAAAVPQPAWSPDGSRLAWSSGTVADPSVSVATPGEPVGVVSTPFLPFYLYWSPDGSRVSFLGNGTRSIELGLVDADDLTSLIVDAGGPYYYAWSPDSDEIFAHVGNAELRLIDVPGASVEVVQRATGRFQAPAWTSGGVVYLESGPSSITARGLARLRQADDGQRIVRGPPEGPGEVLVDLEGFGSFDIADGRLAYTTNPRPNAFVKGDLYVLDADGNSVRVSSGPILAFEWDPTGHRLLYLELAGDPDAVTAHWVVWQAGAESLRFGEFVPSGGFLANYLPFWDQYARSLTLWSPDGTAFTYAGLEDSADTSSAAVWIQPVAPGADPIMLRPGEFSVWSP